MFECSCRFVYLETYTLIDNEGQTHYVVHDYFKLYILEVATRLRPVLIPN
jgi:hypothetical protein